MLCGVLPQILSPMTSPKLKLTIVALPYVHGSPNKGQDSMSGSSDIVS